MELIQLQSFDIQKYEAIAYNTPRHGAPLRSWVETNWAQWEKIVDESDWLKHWLRAPQRSASEVAHTIYTTAVWGFGVEQWSTTKAAHQLGLLRGKGTTISGVSSQWDAQLLKDLGLRVPREFADLDRWLTPMWLSLT